jgi:hypothetical protein
VEVTNTRLLGLLSLACLITTVLWLALLILGLASAGPLGTFDQVLAYVSGLSAVFIATYANAALVTITALALFAGLHVHLRSAAPLWSAVAMAFLPVYGAMNLCAYLSQITVVPRVLELRGIPGDRETADFWLRQLIQAWPDSAVFVVNNLAYAVLAVPSVIFGVLLFKSGGASKRGSGVLLALSGLASFVGFIGIVSRIGWLGQGSLVGGVLFLLALISLTYTFMSVRPAEAAAG